MMLSDFEAFANMTIIQWLSVLTIALSATVVRLLVEKNGFSIREFVVGSILAGFLTYLVALYCFGKDISGKITGVIVGCSAYQASNILIGLGRLGSAFARDPIAFVKKARKDMRDD